MMRAGSLTQPLGNSTLIILVVLDSSPMWSYILNGNIDVDNLKMTSEGLSAISHCHLEDASLE